MMCWVLNVLTVTAASSTDTNIDKILTRTGPSTIQNAYLNLHVE